MPISLYGRNSISGTYEFFGEIALNNGDYKDEDKQQPGSEAVVHGVASDRSAIGYSGLDYKTNDVRAVPLASYNGGKCYDTSAEATYSGQYPIARFLTTRHAGIDDFISSECSRARRLDLGHPPGPPDHLRGAHHRAPGAAGVSDRGLLRRPPRALR